MKVFFLTPESVESIYNDESLENASPQELYNVISNMAAKTLDSDAKPCLVEISRMTNNGELDDFFIFIEDEETKTIIN